MIGKAELVVLLIVFFFGGFLVGLITMWSHHWQKTLEEHKKNLDKWLAKKGGKRRMKRKDQTRKILYSRIPACGPGMIAKDAHEMRPFPGSPSLDILLANLETATDGRYRIEGTQAGRGRKKEIWAGGGQKILKVATEYPADEPPYVRIFRLKDLIKQLLRAIAAEG